MPLSRSRIDQTDKKDKQKYDRCDAVGSNAAISTESLDKTYKLMELLGVPSSKSTQQQSCYCRPTAHTNQSHTTIKGKASNKYNHLALTLFGPQWRLHVVQAVEPALAHQHQCQQHQHQPRLQLT